MNKFRLRGFTLFTISITFLSIVSFVYISYTKGSSILTPEKVAAQKAAQCLVYTINDAIKPVKSTIIAIDLYGVQNPQVLELDDDVEGLDIHPIDNTVWIAGTINGRPAVGVVDLATGSSQQVVTLQGGVAAIEGLAFKPVSLPTDVPELWAWSQRQELFQIDMTTGQTTMFAQYNSEVEGLAWANDGLAIYGAGRGDLYKIDPATKQINLIDSGFGASGIEGLDMRPDGHLMISNESGGDLIVYTYNLETLQIEPSLTYRVNMAPFMHPSSDLDIESISWPDDCEIPSIGSGWVMTQGGDTFSQEFAQNTPGSIDAALIAAALGEQVDPSLSSYSFLQSSTGQLPLNNSARNFSLNSYLDSNNVSQDGVTWFEFLSSQLGLSVIPKPISLNQNLINGLTTDTVSSLSPDLLAGDVRIYHSTGDINLSKIHTCDTKAIFIIEGNLTMDPNFVNSGFDKGCMFLVNGEVIINPGANAGTDATKLIYERIEAFFIANKFTTAVDGDGLYIKGGIVADQITFGRNIGEHNAYAPSEIVAYDPRYMHLFQNLLTYQYPNNILEKQFIRSIQQ